MFKICHLLNSSARPLVLQPFYKSCPALLASAQDIAAEANVSKATVSLALKKHPRISDETRERVERVAKKLGYRPNPELSKLMATMKREPIGKQGTLAFIRSGTSLEWEPMERYFYDEVSTSAESYGYRVEPFWIYDPRENPKRINATLWNRGIDGLIIPMIHPDRYNKGVRTLPIEWEKFSVVEIADTLQEPKLSGIRHNHFGGMLQTVSELEALGYERIGLYMAADVELRTHHRWTAATPFEIHAPTDRGIARHFPQKYDVEALLAWIETTQIDTLVSPGIEVYTMLREAGLFPGDLAVTLHQPQGPSR